MVQRGTLMPSVRSLPTPQYTDDEKRALVDYLLSLKKVHLQDFFRALNLPRTTRGRDAVTERQLRLVVAVPDWREQRAMWSELTPAVRSESGAHMGDDAPEASTEPSTAEGITPGPATASGVSACGMLPRAGLG
jgi:hypothetical protein